mgnify:CR=1 FL=1
MKRFALFTVLSSALFAGLAGCGEPPAESVRPDEAVLKENADKPKTGKAPMPQAGGMPEAQASGLDPTK